MNSAGLFVAAATALVATILVISVRRVVHALLFLVLSLLAVAIMMFQLGAPFAAALEVIIYAGAIIVLFVFVVMMIAPGRKTAETEQQWLRQVALGPPVAVAVVLAAELGAAVLATAGRGAAWVDPKRVGLSLFGPYLVAVGMVSMLLLAGLIGAYHLGRPTPPERQTGREP